MGANWLPGWWALGQNLVPVTNVRRGSRCYVNRCDGPGSARRRRGALIHNQSIKILSAKEQIREKARGPWRTGRTAPETVPSFYLNYLGEAREEAASRDRIIAARRRGKTWEQSCQKKKPGRRKESTNTRVIISLLIGCVKIFPVQESRPAGCFPRRSLGLVGVSSCSKGAFAAAVSVWVLNRPRVDISSSTTCLFIHIWVSRTSRTTAKVPAPYGPFIQSSVSGAPPAVCVVPIL